MSGKSAAEEGGLHIIARIRTPFPEKFGIPRQPGLVEGIAGTVVFEPPYRNEDALRGLEGFSHIWLIWQFDRAARQDWSPTVRPPRLGGNERMGVFATRSPFRPNPIGLSVVRLAGIERHTPDGPVLHVLGADMADGTPLYDIKPYLPYCDSVPSAVGGFTDNLAAAQLAVDFPPALLARIPGDERAGLLGALAADPRPRYQADGARVYGMGYSGHNIRFRVEGDTLHVVEVE